MIPLCFSLVLFQLHSCSIHMHAKENEKRAFETWLNNYKLKYGCNNNS